MIHNPDKLEYKEENVSTRVKIRHGREIHDIYIKILIKRNSNQVWNTYINSGTHSLKIKYHHIQYQNVYMYTKMS